MSRSPPMRGIPEDIRTLDRFFRQMVPGPSTVGPTQIQTNSVTEPKIAPAAVTGTKIALQAVTVTKIADAAVSDSKLRNSTGHSVIGRAAATDGAPADITCGADNKLLIQRSGVLGFDVLVETDIPAEIARDMEVSAAISALNLASGVYTPALTNVANLDASTTYECQYLRVGSVVTVTGKVDVDPTAAAVTKLGIALPVASNFGAAEDCAGVAFAPGIAGQGAAILADAANNRAQMEWIAVDTTNQPMAFSFAYQII